ncbi:MAG TPA: hypothetical protein VMT87_00060, partial [Vicinamibacteria bacterium]|nr:hypothetical protein [Vicinamibacteria bacterium]
NGVTGAGEPASLSGAGLLAAGAALASALIAGGRGSRATRLAGAVLGGLGGAGLATSAWPTADLASAGGTAALALAAAVLTFAARRGNPALRGLAWTFLVLGGLRLLMVDVPGGRPLSLFVGLVTYGGALLAAQASRGSSASMRETSVVEPAREAE